MSNTSYHIVFVRLIPHNADTDQTCFDWLAIYWPYQVLWRDVLLFMFGSQTSRHDTFKLMIWPWINALRLIYNSASENRRLFGPGHLIEKIRRVKRKLNTNTVKHKNLFLIKIRNLLIPGGIYCNLAFNSLKISLEVYFLHLNNYLSCHHRLLHWLIYSFTDRLNEFIHLLIHLFISQRSERFRGVWDLGTGFSLFCLLFCFAPEPRRNACDAGYLFIQWLNWIDSFIEHCTSSE